MVVSFDRVNHDVLMARVKRRVKDRRVLVLINRYLQAGMREGGLVSPRTEGTPQGGPLSPLLSNVLLDGLDKELEHRGHRFARYADDAVLHCKSRRQAEYVLDRIRERFLACHLELHPGKTRIARTSIAPRTIPTSSSRFSATRSAPARRWTSMAGCL